MKFNLKLVLSLVLFIGFAMFVYRTSVFRISKNFEAVHDGRLYRSAQLTTEEMEDVIKKYGIKTVISLRGSPGKTDYYERQDITLARLKTKFVPVAMSDEFYPNENELKEIFTEFSQGDYPMLIHCRAGADRTGLIAALYQQAYMNKSVEESLEQLTFKNWHVRLFRPAMSDFVRKFKGVDWVMNEFSVCSQDFNQYREKGYSCPGLKLPAQASQENLNEQN